MEKLSIKQAYLNLKNEVNVNPESIKVRQRLEELRTLVHERIIENLKMVYSDYWDKSAAYERFVNNLNERTQMEKAVLNKEIWLNISIDDISNQISLAIITALSTVPDIFDVKLKSEKKEITNVGAEGVNEELKNVSESLDTPSERIEDVSKESEDISESLETPNEGTEIVSEDLGDIWENPEIPNDEEVDNGQTLNSETEAITEEYLIKNKEIIIRLVRDKASRWFSMDKSANLSKFYVELDWKEISYNRILKLFLWKHVLESHENAFRKYVMLSEKIFGEETIKKWHIKIRNEILLRKDWDELEKSEDLRKSYFVNLGSSTYKYNLLITIFWVKIWANKIFSKDVYKDLSRAIFWKHWRKILKTEKTVKRFRNEEEFPYWYQQWKQWLSDKKLVENINVSAKKEVEDDGQEESRSEDNLVKNTWRRKSKIEIERENYLKVFPCIARSMLISNPELKESWFWADNEKTWPSTFVLLYNGHEYNIREIWDNTGLYWKNTLINFNQFVDKFFWKDYAAAMRAEVAKKNKNQEIQLDSVRKDNCNWNLEKGEDVLLDENWWKVVEENVIEDKNEDEIMDDEHKEESESVDEKYSVLEKKFFALLGEKAWKKTIDFNYFINKSSIIKCFDEIVEEYVESQRELISDKLSLFMSNDYWKVIFQCKKKYPKADSSTLREKCKKLEYIEEIKTEYLLQKQTEVREKIFNYISLWADDGWFFQFCCEVIRDLEQSNLDQECYDYFIDSVENQYKKSHDNDEKWILDMIKNEEKEKKAEQEKARKDIEVQDYCKRNDIEVSEYQIIEDLSHKLKRKWVDDRWKLMKYLIKLMKRKDSLRESEFECKLDDSLIEKLDSIWISVIRTEVKECVSISEKKEENSFEWVREEKKETIIISLNEVKKDAIWEFISEASKRGIEIENISSIKKQILNLCSSENWENKFFTTIKRDSFWKPIKQKDRWFFYFGGHSWAFVAKKINNKITITDWYSHDEIDWLINWKIW